MADDKVIIEVALNENQMRTANPNVPYSPEEIAAAARQCYEAGAAVVHFHGRDGETGAPLMSDPEVSLAAQQLIQDASPLIAYPTYGSMTKVLDWYTIGDPAPERFRHFSQGIAAGIKFELCPVDLGAYDANAFPSITGENAPTEAILINTGADQSWIGRFAKTHELTPTFALFDTRHVRNLKNMVRWGLAPERPVVKLFLNGFDAPLSEDLRMLTYYLDLMKDLFPTTPSWMPVVAGRDQLPMAAVGASLGGHVRVGLGDFDYGARSAPTNAQLVESVVRLAREIGREPASPDEARAIWNVRPSQAATVLSGARLAEQA